MTRILAIDPGNTRSGFTVIDANTRRPIHIGKLGNHALLHALRTHEAYDHAAIEMVASYGMAVGAEVFETCVWIGRFHEALASQGTDAQLVKRLAVKTHHCHDSRAKDSNITQALIDRFTAGQPNRGKGTSTEPGWFHGFSGDIWQAYALAVYVADTAAPNFTHNTNPPGDAA